MRTSTCWLKSVRVYSKIKKTIKATSKKLSYKGYTFQEVVTPILGTQLLPLYIVLVHYTKVKY